MVQTVTALYDTYDFAVSAVDALEAAGIPHSDISIVSNNGLASVRVLRWLSVRLSLQQRCGGSGFGGRWYSEDR